MKKLSILSRTNRTFFLGFILIALLGACSTPDTPSKELPRSTPEAEGISSANIIAFLDAAAESSQELHSFMILRHGKVVAEGWWDPYKPELRHTLYSTSKSFTSTAIGFAVSEGLITVEDKVISFFPNDLPDTISDNLAAMRIRDLLSMSAGQDPEPRLANSENWPKTFLAAPVPNVPGSTFLYNSSATYMLSAIITKVTGETVLQYLTPRLFNPLQIEGMDWEIDPKGVNTGGWGLRLKTEDMAKFGHLYLQKGKWNGKQIISEEWVAEATSKKIDQAPDLPEDIKAPNDWMQGYCYKFWRSKNDSYRADGAFGQLIMIFPNQDAVVAVTAEAKDMQKEMNLVHNYLFPAFEESPLEADDTNYKELLNRIAALSLNPPVSGENADMEKEISGSTYSFNEGTQQQISFSFEDDKCAVNLRLKDDKTFPLLFGKDNWELFETNKPGANLVSQSPANLQFLLPAKVAGAYSWQGDNELQLVLRYIESPHSEYYNFEFDGDEISMTVSNSLNKQGNNKTLQGKKENQNP